MVYLILWQFALSNGEDKSRKLGVLSQMTDKVSQTQLMHVLFIYKV
jgi:hypothetical protein